jgi:phosphohistidine phosphatase SixA
LLSRLGLATGRRVSGGDGDRLVFQSTFRSLYAATGGICVLRFTLTVVALLMLAPAQATEAGWALLREGGHVVLIRHAMAPGVGDPPNFEIEKCSTQRNLSDRGQLQARKMGALFAARAATTERVLSSRYCRCLETARLAFGESLVEESDVLNRLALAKDDAARKTQLTATFELIRDFSDSGNLVLVTHQENIEALTGVSPREGEAIIVRAEGEKLHVMGRIIFN